MLLLCRERQTIVAGSMMIKAIFPEIRESRTAVDAAKGQDVLGSGMSRV
jgi:hypothetical protein